MFAPFYMLKLIREKVTDKKTTLLIETIVKESKFDPGRSMLDWAKQFNTNVSQVDRAEIGDSGAVIKSSTVLILNRLASLAAIFAFYAILYWVIRTTIFFQ